MTTAVRTLRRATLEDLRAKIDAIDESLHDLLMRRAGLAADIARLKNAAPGANGVFFRAGREAEVMRRILGRHRGPFPASAVVRIWREIIGGLLGLQGELTVATSAPELIDMAREHFGSGAVLRRCASSTGDGGSRSPRPTPPASSQRFRSSATVRQRWCWRTPHPSRAATTGR